MKAFKKIAVSLLALTMSFSLFACEEDAVNSSKDSSVSSNVESVTPENSSSDDNTSSGGSNVTPDDKEEVKGEGAKYIEGIVNSIKEANTITATMAMAFNFDYFDKEYDPSVEISGNDTSKSYATVDFTFTIAKTETAYNVKVEGKMEGIDSWFEDDGMEQTDEFSDTIEGYLVDGYLYDYDEYEEQWYKYALDWNALLGDEEGAADWDAMLGQLYQDLLGGDIANLYNALGPVFEQTLLINIQNNEYSFTLDVAEDIMSVVDYFENLEYTQTVTAYFNSLMVAAGSEVTLEDILTQAGAVGTMKVGDLYAAVNEIVVAETEMTLDGLKSYVMAQIDLTAFEQYFLPEDFAYISALFTYVEDLNIADTINEYADMTINEVLSALSSTEEEPVEINLANTTASILAVCNQYTLEEALNEITEDNFDYVLALLQGIDLKELSESVSIQFVGYAIGSVGFTNKVDFALDIPEATVTMKESLTLSLSLSDASTTITPPADAIEGELDWGNGSYLDGVCDVCGDESKEVNVFEDEYGEYEMCADCEAEYGTNQPTLDGACDLCGSTENVEVYLDFEFCEACLSSGEDTVDGVCDYCFDETKEVTVYEDEYGEYEMCDDCAVLFGDLDNVCDYCLDETKEVAVFVDEEGYEFEVCPDCAKEVLAPFESDGHCDYCDGTENVTVQEDAWGEYEICADCEAYFEEE